MYLPVAPSVRGDALLTFGKLATFKDKIQDGKVYKEKTLSIGFGDDPLTQSKRIEGQSL